MARLRFIIKHRLAPHFTLRMLHIIRVVLGNRLLRSEFPVPKRFRTFYSSHLQHFLRSALMSYSHCAGLDSDEVFYHLLLTGLQA